MGSCSIIRNPINKQIEKVLAPNGESSILFDKAVEHLRSTKDDVIENKVGGNQNYVFQEDGVTVTLKRRNGDLYLENIQNENGYPIENVFNRVMDKFDKDGEFLYVDKNHSFSEKLISNAGFMENFENPLALVRENEKFKAIPSQKLREEALTLQSVAYTQEFEDSFGKWNYSPEERVQELNRIEEQKKVAAEVQSRNAKKAKRSVERSKRLRERRAQLQISPNNNVENKDNNPVPEEMRLSNDEIFGVENETYERVPVIGETRYLTDKNATDKNGEPHLTDILNFDRFIRNENTKITPAEIYKVSNNFGSSVESMEEFYKEMNKTFFPNGYFEVNTDLLFNSKLYTKGEAMYVLEHPEVQSNMKRVFEAVRKEYLANNTYLENTMDNSQFDEELIQYKDEIDDLGKVQKEDPIEVENYFKEKLAGISDRALFDKIAEKLEEYPSFVQRYNSDKVFADNVFSKYSNMSKIFRAQVIKDKFSVRTKGSRFATMYETLQYSDKSMELDQDLNFLKGVDEFVWNSEKEDVKALLQEYEAKLLSFNIDAIGLSEMYDKKSKTEIVELLDKVNDFVKSVKSNTHSVADIESLAKTMDEFFGNDMSYDKIYKKVSETNKNKTLVDITSEKNDVELFETQGLVKTADGFYQKVSVEETLEESYNKAVEAIIENPSLINRYYFKNIPFYKDGKFDSEAVMDEINREDVKEAVKTYIREKAQELNLLTDEISTETAQKLTIYKLMNKNILNTEKMPNFVREEVKFQNFNGNYHYLTNNFHADFQNYILKNKLKNTSLYNNVLKYFEVSENGISLKTDNNTIKQRIRNSFITDQTFENLRQYSIISKNKTMQELFEFENDGIRRHNAVENQRYYYSNNFSQMERFKGDYEVSDNVMVANNTTDRFLRVKEGFFEKVGQVDGVSVYGRQQVVENPNFNNYEYKLEIPKVDMTVAKEMVKPSVFSGSKAMKFYNKQEEHSLQEQHNACK